MTTDKIYYNRVLKPNHYYTSIYDSMSKMKQRLVRKMYDIDYWYDYEENGHGEKCALRFVTSYGYTVHFENWKTVKDWLNGVVID